MSDAPRSRPDLRVACDPRPLGRLQGARGRRARALGGTPTELRSAPGLPPAALAILGPALAALLATIAATLALPSWAAEDSLDVVFVLDNSGSMRTHDPGFLTRTAVADFASTLAADPDVEARVGVVLFDEAARLALPLTPVGSAGFPAALQTALAGLDFSGQRTHTPAAIERALYELRQQSPPATHRAVVLLSDGRIDTGDPARDLEASRWLRDELASESREAGIRIFGVAFTETADYQLMQALALKTRADYYRAFAADELATVVDDVLTQLAEARAPQSPVLPGEPGLGPETAAVPPPVAAAPPTPPGWRTIGWLPALVLLGAAALVWQRRHRRSPLLGAERSVEAAVVAPPAQLLDLDDRLEAPGRALPLRPGRTRIGRDPHNEIVIDLDTISSEHAVIELRQGRYWLEDRRSTNGTWLGDRRLVPEEPVALKGGDRIRFADVDLMFALEGYVPLGGTLFLSATSTPPPASRVDTGPEGRSSGAEAHGSQAELASPPAPAVAEPDLSEAASSTSDSPMREDASLSPVPEVASVSPIPEDPASGGGLRAGEDVARLPDAQVRRLRECLDEHLRRVAEISPAFSDFVACAFDDEIRSALATAAREAPEESDDASSVTVKDYTRDGVRYVVCALPTAMEEARDRFVHAFGGFTRLLTEQLQSESFRRDRCEILCVLTVGLATPPWVSLSIVPDEGRDPRIDLLSYELLTEEERHEIEPALESDNSHSGLA